MEKKKLLPGEQFTIQFDEGWFQSGERLLKLDWEDYQPQDYPYNWAIENLFTGERRFATEDQMWEMVMREKRNWQRRKQQEKAENKKPFTDLVQRALKHHWK